MKSEKLTAVLDRLCSVVDERFESRTAFAGEWLDYSGENYTPSTVTSKLAGSQTLRLREVLSMADFLSLDYRWLFSGSRTSWDEMATELVIVGLGEYGTVTFEIPLGWPNLNLVLRPSEEPLPIVVRRQEEKDG